MARTDWEAAWTELQGWIASEKPGYGRAELLERMATLAAAHRVAETLIERTIRIHGPRALLQLEPPETAAPGGGGNASPDKPDPSRPTDEPEEVHDGREHPVPALR